MQHHYTDLIALFAHCFEEKWQTQLVKGSDEPLYLPASHAYPFHRVLFAHGYFSSALHETAHWLIAGRARRQLIDYGYWYQPDGRTAEQQALFQQVEAKPQALEWILSKAAAHRFHVSLDNLQGSNDDVTTFKQAIYQQVACYCERGLPLRADRFRQALAAFYQTDEHLKLGQFSFSEIA